MKMPVFGRKPVTPREEHPGHAAVLRTLTEMEPKDPTARSRLAGRIVFDLVYRLISDERGARMEDLLGILGSVGGYSCIVGVMHFLRETRQSAEAVGMRVVDGKDGQRYYFGDLPNESLLESNISLLGLALGAAQALGARVSLTMVHDVMRHVAGTVGGPEFGIPGLPPGHDLTRSPIEYVRLFWPKVREALDVYAVPVTRRATTLGFAIQQAMTTGKDVMDPILAARIVVECAVPMAKVDPARFS